MRLLRSFSFRLAAAYAVLFTLSLTLILATYQLVSITLPRNEVKRALTAEAESFAASYRGDLHALGRKLERRAGEAAPRAGFHLLTDVRGAVVTTNLPSWPEYESRRWVSIEADVYRDGDEDDHEALALDSRLADGSRLLVGRDVEELDDLEEAIRAAGLYLVAATLVLAALGALLMNWAIGRRLGAVSGTARQVMGGDLSRRVPISGSGDDFDRLAATLNVMLDRVEAGVEAVRTVSDSVAHELRTPVTRLQASLRRLSAGEDPPSPAVLEALDEADRLQSVFDSVLRISRIESGRHEAEFRRLDLSELIADAADLYAPAADDRHIRLDREIAPDVTVTGDRDLLFQAAANLIDNAVKFTPAGGAVTLRVRQQPETNYFEVADTGPGIAEEHRGRVGERFFRAPAAAGAAGFGLGLSLVAAIARLHGASLDFPSGGPGLTARLSLPRSGAPASP
ncbi:MAG: HAMP domain-containing sensor histidine kinase [Allosphingosinicella sp.]